MKDSKNLKKYSILILILMISFLFTACESHNNMEVNEEDKMKGELSVYYVDYADQTKGVSGDYTFETTLLLQDLQNEYPELEIKPTTFGNSESFMTQVSTELASGKGSDLLLFDYRSMVDWNKMSNNGVFENLSPYIKEDENYIAENYFESAIKAGQIDNKQYILPLSFNCISLHAGKNKLLTQGITIKDNYSYENILSVLDESIEQANNDEQIIPVALSFDRSDLLSCFMEAFGMTFVNYENKSPAIGKDSLLEVCTLLKKLYPYSSSAFSNMYENLTKTQNTQRTIFTLSNKEYVGEIITQKAMMEQINDESMFFAMPSVNNSNETTGQIYHYSAINANSKNKQLAYDVAKKLMDLAGRENIGYKVPISIDKFDEWIQGFETNVAKIEIDGNLVSFEFDTKDAKEAKNVVDNIKHVTLNNYKVMSIVEDGMAPYIEGDTKTFDECYDETVNKLNLYINE